MSLRFSSIKKAKLILLPIDLRRMNRIIVMQAPTHKALFLFNKRITAPHHLAYTFSNKMIQHLSTILWVIHPRSKSQWTLVIERLIASSRSKLTIIACQRILMLIIEMVLHINRTPAISHKVSSKKQTALVKIKNRESTLEFYRKDFTGTSNILWINLVFRVDIK